MIQKVSLLNSKSDFLFLLLAIGLILSYSLLIEFQNYKKLTRFTSNIVSATVIKQYEKTKLTKNGKIKKYQVLKLKSDSGFLFYTTANKSLHHLQEKKLNLELWASKITFYEYLTSFYAYSHIKYIYKTQSLKQKLNSYLSLIHTDKNIAHIYQALYSASPLPKNLQITFSTLGISHLLAISGFHLGVIGGLLFFLLKYPYKFLQNRYFPYRNSKIDLFFVVTSLLLLYMIFLDYPASLLRSFAMLVIGFILYDRGIKIVSLQTLALTVIFLLALFPRLTFAVGFWLSVSGVFYIFLFLIYFKNFSKIWQFILIPFWVYLLMLPFSLAIFSNFSIYHPLSIIWTSLFTIFYPLSIFLHLIGLGTLFDGVLENLILLGKMQTSVLLGFNYLIIQVLLSLLSIWKKHFVWVLLLFDLSIFIYATYDIFTAY